MGHYDPRQPIRMSSARPAWVAWALGGAMVAILGGGYLGLHQTARVADTAATPSRTAVTPSLSQSTAAPVSPSNGAPPPSGPSLWTTFATMDTHYLTQLVDLQHQALPWLSTSVANNDTLSVSDFNNPIVLNQYHVPPLPTSLTAAGINPATLPANNSLVGMSPSLANAWQAEADRGPAVDHLSAAQLTQAVTTAVQFLLDEAGNGYSAVYLENPFAAWVSGSRTYALTSPAVSVNALTGPQGLFAQRNYIYQAWADVSHVTMAPVSSPDPNPAGHVVTTLQVKNLVTYIVMGGIYQGHEIIGIYPFPPTTDDVDLIQDNGQERWYVSWGLGVNTGNPTQVLWTGPAVSQ